MVKINKNGIYMKYQNILISGASSGMGAELARRYAKKGATLGLMALAGAELDAIKVEAEKLGATNVFIYPVDVSNREQARNAVAEFAKQAGRIDLWIACAGVDIEVSLNNFNDESANTAEKMYEVNLMGLMYTTNAVLEQMLTQRKAGFLKRIKPKGAGHIVGMASLAGKKIYPVHADYSATKTAVTAYLESLRVRLIGKPITITTVSPGFVSTPMIADHTHPMPFTVSAEKAVDIITNGIAQGKEHIEFPHTLSLATKAMRILPSPIWKVVAKLSERI